MAKVSGSMSPMSFDQFIALMNLRFKLFGRSDTQKKFDKYKHKYYTEDTDGNLLVRDNLSLIEIDNEVED